MASKFNRSNAAQQLYHQNKSVKELEKSDLIDLEQVFANSYDPILVTDKDGYVILANPSTRKMMGIGHNEIIGSNVKNLVSKGLYDRSPAWEALETRSVVTAMVRTCMGTNLMCTSIPIIDKDNNVAMVITNARDNDIFAKYRASLEKKRIETERYKSAAEYLGEVDLDLRMPVARSKKMRKIIASCNVIAKTDSSVILYGESGTGKEVIARYIHRNSLRSNEPIIPVNCAAIPNELLESEFFGYEPGAFTGASSKGKLGLFEVADKGTLFLDEIGELPLSMQSKLLRVLETGEVKRLGSTVIRRIDTRIISATNRDLETMIKENSFRSDLYYRLNVIPLYLPPLRERISDICVLANKFLQELNKKYALSKKFTDKTKEVFLHYSWPGNIRELRNVIERLVVTSINNDLAFDDDFILGGKVKSSTVDDDHTEKKIPYKGTLKSVLKAVEEEYINQVLTECHGRVGEAALRLGIHRSMLYRKTKVMES